MLLEQIGAALVLLVCLLIWLHMAFGAAWRLRLWQRLTAAPRRWSAARRKQRTAQREAARLIERARRPTGVDREGNVYRPKSFDRRTRDDDEPLH